RQRVVVLQAAELALDSGAATVEAPPLVRTVGDRAERDCEAVLLEGNDRDAAALARFVVDAVVVVAHVHRARLGLEAASAERVETVRQPFARGSELAGEAVAGPMRRSASELRFQAGMLRDQVGYPRPRRDRVESLHEAGTEHRPSAVAPPARPAKSVKLRDQG